MISRFLPVAGLLLGLFPLIAADPKTAVFTDPEKAGPDFTIQGEYAGENSGAQVIALGGGKFHILGWSPGLPGTSEDAEKKVEVDAQREGERVVFNENGWQGAIAGGQLTGTNDERRTWRLSKAVRQSPTLGEKAPAGAVILFDGTNASAWQDGKIQNGGGMLECGTKSKQKFGDCALHIEFRTPFIPEARGQARGNSGVYLQDRYEVQVLDSFGLGGENNECGGIYSVAKPRVNMCFPPLSWQTYDIDFQSAKFSGDGKKTANAKMTVRHNGVLIHDHVEVPHATTAAGQAEGAAPGSIQLQNHGNPVVYRNIWIVERK